jgi:hypothetical protein
VLQKFPQDRDEEVGQCKCRPGTFLAFNECEECHYSCKNCNGPTIDSCTECKDPNAT